MDMTKTWVKFTYDYGKLAVINVCSKFMENK